MFERAIEMGNNKALINLGRIDEETIQYQVYNKSKRNSLNKVQVKNIQMNSSDK